MVIKQTKTAQRKKKQKKKYTYKHPFQNKQLWLFLMFYVNVNKIWNLDELWLRQAGTQYFCLSGWHPTFIFDSNVSYSKLECFRSIFKLLVLCSWVGPICTEVDDLNRIFCSCLIPDGIMNIRNKTEKKNCWYSI